MTIIVSRQSYLRMKQAISSRETLEIFGRNDKGRECLIGISWKNGRMKVSCRFRSLVCESMSSFELHGPAEADEIEDGVMIFRPPMRNPVAVECLDHYRSNAVGGVSPES